MYGTKPYLFGTGTQKVENILKQTFPNASIARVDYDIIKKDLVW